MSRISLAALALVTLTQLASPRRASAETEAVRTKLRQLGEAAVYVIEGGRNPPPDYKYSDRYDRDNAIAKNSALADATYANRILLADWLTSDVARFTADLARIGKTLAAGTVMLSGPRFDLAQRIPLAIPETSDDTCTGPCLTAYRQCTLQNAAAGITSTMTNAQRQCLYWHFRKDLDDTIRAMILNHAAAGSLWADQAPNAPPVLSPYLAIALGTPVSFYSHNPLKPVGYHFDAKRNDKARCTDAFNQQHQFVRGPVECSDFDLKIYSPDLTLLMGRLTIPPQSPAAAAINRWVTGQADRLAPADVRAVTAALPINLKIVDGGKRHVFKNAANGNGVYEQFTELRDFVERWTNAFGREVDIKLEFSFNLPLYQAQPAGPIAVVDSTRPVGNVAPVGEAPPPPPDNEDESGEDWFGLILAVVAGME